MHFGLKNYYSLLVYFAAASATTALPALAVGASAQQPSPDRVSVSSAAISPFTILEVNGAKDIQPGQAAYNIGEAVLENLKQSIRHNFILRNDSDAAVIIDRVQPECECTSAVVRGSSPSAPYLVPAGGRITIGVAIDPHYLGPGPLDKLTLIFLAGQQQPAVTLHITGTIDPAAAYEPSNYFFGYVPLGNSPSTSFTLELDPRVYGKDAPDPVCSDPNFIVTRDSHPNVAAQPGKIVRQYTVRVAPGGHIGYRQVDIAMPDKIGILAADEFSAAAIVTGDISSDQTGVSFGIVKPNMSASRDVTLTATKATALHGLKVTCASGEIKASLLPPSPSAKPADNATAMLNLVFTPTKLGTFKSQIDIKTQSGQVLELPVWASVRNAIETNATGTKPTPDVLDKRSHQ